MVGKVPVPLKLLTVYKISLHPSKSIKKLDRLPPSFSQRISVLPDHKDHKPAKNVFIPLLVFSDYYNKTPKDVELYGNFSRLGWP